MMSAIYKSGILGLIFGGIATHWFISHPFSAEPQREYRNFFANERQQLIFGGNASFLFDPSFDSSDQFEMTRILDERIKSWTYASPYCAGFPSKGRCDDGDSVLFNGLLCFSGMDIGCETVRNSLNQKTGEWVRSPRRVALSPLVDEDERSFSRDHILGILLYAAKTHDFAAVDHWQNWMKNTPKCVLLVGGKCVLESKFAHICRTFNFGCLYLPGINRYLDTVLSLAGDRNRAWRISEGRNLATEAILRFEMKLSSSGYPLHLKAVSLFLLGELGYDSEFVGEMAKQLVARDPNNLFFQYLADASSTGALLQSKALIDQCRWVGSWNLSEKGNFTRRAQNQWSFERETSERAWESSMGWDCVFLGRLLKSRLSNYVEQVNSLAFDSERFSDPGLQ